MHDSIKSTHLIDDAVRHFREERVREFGPVRSHEVRRLNCSERADVFVRASVTNQTDALDLKVGGAVNNPP
jgi:hypothetical protein